MIAVCPACHDAIHHGTLAISDDTIYLWKGIKRLVDSALAHIHVDPAPDVKILAGSICLATTNEGLTVFNLSNSNRLAFRTLDGDLLMLNSHLVNVAGKEVLRVVDNHVRVHKDKRVKFETRPGRAQITVPTSKEYLPDWITKLMRQHVPDFGMGPEMVALDVEVLEPGYVKVHGYWYSPEGAIIITRRGISFCTKGRREPTTLAGPGDDSTVLKWTGPITPAAFTFHGSGRPATFQV